MGGLSGQGSNQGVRYFGYKEVREEPSHFEYIWECCMEPIWSQYKVVRIILLYTSNSLFIRTAKTTIISSHAFHTFLTP